jgi:transcriptional antiterminator RfaH
MKSWYAINSKPHQELLAESSLKMLGVETLCPLSKETKVIRRKIRKSTSPLFPGYLFARFDIDRCFRGVLYARGVKRVVAFGSEPAVVDDEMIEGIRSRLMDDCVVRPGPSFLPGQPVRIQQGPLHGFEAVFEREMKGEQRAVLLLKALFYQARLVVDLQNIVNA